MAQTRPARQPRLAEMDLVATTAHELKSPLVLIRGLAEMLVGGEFGGVSRTQARYLEKIGGASQRLLEVVENLLTINKSHHGRMTLELAPVAVNSVLAEVMDELQPRIMAHKMTVMWSPGLRTPLVMADRRLLHQVFFNLLDNTLKYSPPKSAITIKFHQARQKLAIQVRDQGIGIKPSDLKKLFERFGVVNQPINAHASSSGLGLFIVKSLLELQGGQITAQRLRQGSCFTVSLPIMEQLELFNE